MFPSAQDIVLLGLKYSCPPAAPPLEISDALDPIVLLDWFFRLVAYDEHQGIIMTSSSSSSSMNRYWIPQLDIHRKVITQELQYYLGPEATVRPFTREVRCPSFPRTH
jgi:hypothetical protein